jgi:hypothetical protein
MALGHASEFAERASLQDCTALRMNDSMDNLNKAIDKVLTLKGILPVSAQ